MTLPVIRDRNLFPQANPGIEHFSFELVQKCGLFGTNDFVVRLTEDVMFSSTYLMLISTGKVEPFFRW